MKRHRRKIVLGILVFLALIVGLALMLRRPSSAKELATYRAELRAKGENLTVNELTAGHPTNGMETLNELLAIAVRLPRDPAAPLPMVLMQGVDTGKARVGWTQPMVPLSGPRGTATWETVATRLDLTEPLLQQLRSAIQQPGLDAEWDPADLRTRPPGTAVLMTKRAASQWLASATIIEMHRGRLNEASDYLHSLATFARVDRDNPALRQQMIRTWTGGLSISATWELLQTNAWTDAQLACMQTDLEQLNFAAAIEKGMVGVRAMFSDDMTSAPWSVLGKVSGSGASSSREPLIDRLKEGAALRLWDPAEDQLFYLQNMQINLEATRSLAARQPRNVTRDKFDETTARLNGMNSWAKYRYPASLTTLRYLNRAVETAFRRETERELTITAIALKRFQLRHNHPAPDLAALVPEFLPTLPYDPMSGKPLAYRLNADSTFVLYSVGEDGKDDGGDSTVARPEAPRDMWRGRDAVWPLPVW